jgi:hypothetical protein
MYIKNENSINFRWTPTLTHGYLQGCVKIGTSTTGDLVSISDFVPTLPEKAPIVFVFGSHAHGTASPLFIAYI